jgi:hypothetical protein
MLDMLEYLAFAAQMVLMAAALLAMGASLIYLAARWRAR